MYIIQVAGVVLGLVSFCTGTANLESACSPSSVITIYLTATSTVTETLGLPGLGPYWFPGGPSSPTAQPTATVQTVTETVIITETLASTVTSIKAAASSSTSSESGVYYFSVENGTTVWLGASPSAAESYVLETSTAIIEPLPSSSAISTNSNEYTTITQIVGFTSFVTLTEVSSETALTETPTETLSSTVAAGTASGFAGIGTNGWNGTTVKQENQQTGFQTSGMPWPTSYATAAPRVSAPNFSNHSSASALIPSGKSWNSITARQVREIVIATVEGVVASWTNVWDDGKHPHATSIPVSFSPIPSGITVAGYSGAQSHIWPTTSAILSNVPLSTSALPPSSAPEATSTFSTIIVPASFPIPGDKSGNGIIARQVGGIVTATIDGVVVSWTNFWDGGNPPATPVSVSSDSWAPSSPSVEPASITPPGYSDTWPTPSAILSTAPFPTSSLPSSSASSTFTTIIVPSSGPSSSTQSASATAPLSSPTFPYPNSTIPSTTATSVPTSTCAPDISYLDLGNFTITFDDLPAFSGSAGGDDYPPIFSPYHDLYWSSGFAYAPPPSDPYAPISPPKLAVFVTNQSANVHPVNSTTPPGPGDDVDGQFGAGPNFANSAFWINAYSAYIGCTNAGPDNCEITINGYGYEPNFGNTVLVAIQTAYQPPCPGLVNCELVYVEFGPDFTALASLQIVATLPGNATMNTWYMDNLSIGWTNTTCDAASERYQFALGNPPA